MAEKKLNAKTYQALRAAVPNMDDSAFNRILSARGYVPDIPVDTGPEEWAAQNPGTAKLEAVSDSIRTGIGKLGDTVVGKAVGAGLNAIENQPTAFDLFNPKRSVPAKAWGMTMGGAGTIMEAGARLGRKFVNNAQVDADSAEMRLLDPDITPQERKDAMDAYDAANRRKTLRELVVPTDKLSVGLTMLGLKGAPKGQKLLKPLGATEEVIAPLAGDLGVYRKTPAEALGGSGAKKVEDFLFGNSTAAGERGLEKAQAINLGMQSAEEQATKATRRAGVLDSSAIEAGGEDTARNIFRSNEDNLAKAQRDAALAKEAEDVRLAHDSRRVEGLTGEKNAMQSEADKLKADYDALPPEYKDGVGPANGAASRSGAQLQKETFSNTDTVLKTRNKEMWADFDSNPLMKSTWHSVDEMLADDLDKMAKNIKERGVWKNKGSKDYADLVVIRGILDGPGTLKQIRAVAETLPKGTPLESRLSSVFAQKAANSEIPAFAELGRSYLDAVGVTMERSALSDSLRTVVKGSSPEQAVSAIMNGQHTVNLENIFWSSAIPAATKSAIKTSVFENLLVGANQAARGGKSAVEALKVAKNKMRANYNAVINPKMAAFMETHATNMDAMSAFTAKHPELVSKIDKAAKDIEEILAKGKVDSAQRAATASDKATRVAQGSKVASERAGEAVESAQKASAAYRDGVESAIRDRLALLEKESPTDLVSLSTREGEKGKRVYKPQRKVDKSNIAEATAVGTSGLLSLALGGPVAFGKLMGVYASFKVLSKVPGALARVYYDPKLVGVITAPARFQSNNFANAIALAAAKGKSTAASTSKPPEPKKKSGWEALYKR